MRAGFARHLPGRERDAAGSRVPFHGRASHLHAAPAPCHADASALRSVHGGAAGRRRYGMGLINAPRPQRGRPVLQHRLRLLGEDDLSLPRFLIVLAARWRLGLAVALSVLAAAAAVVSVLPDKFTANAAVLLELRPSDSMSGAALMPLGPGFISTQIDLVTSDRVLGLALRRLQTAGVAVPDSPEQWQLSTGGQGDYTAWAVSQLRTTLEVAPSRDSGLLSVSFTALDRQLAAQVANAVIQAYIQTSLELRVEPARADKRFFDERAAALRDELTNARARLSDLQREGGIVGGTDQRMDVETARLMELSSQVSALQAVTADSGSRESEARGQGGRLSEVVTNPMLVVMQGQLTQQLARLDELRARLGDSHPQVREAQAAAEALRLQLEQASARVASSVGLNNSVNRSRLQQAQAALAGQRERVLRLKGRSDEVAVLEREVQNAQRNYDAMLAQGTRSAMESERTKASVTVIKDATPPARRSSPKLGTALGLAAVAGVLLALGLVLVLEKLDMRLRGAEDVSLALGLPLLVRLPPRRTGRGGGLNSRFEDGPPPPGRRLIGGGRPAAPAPAASAGAGQ